MWLAMRITRIEIRNFRSIRHLLLEPGGSTVLIGPNNVGKTAILDAVRLALTRRWCRSGTRFGATDIRDDPNEDEPAPSSGSVSLHLEESAPGEWPRNGMETPRLPAEPKSDGRRSLRLQVRLGNHRDAGDFHETWQFLDAEGNPAGSPDSIAPTEWPWRYFPVFYLGLPRAFDGPFLPKRRFWEQYLAALELPIGLELAAETVLTDLCDRLREAHPRTNGIMHAIIQSSPLDLRRRDGPDPSMLSDSAGDHFDWIERILDSEPDDPPYSFNPQGLAAQSLTFTGKHTGRAALP